MRCESVVSLRNAIMQIGSRVRNSDTQELGKLLPGQHPWSREAGQRLASLRDERGMSQGDLAKKAKVSRGTISNLERGEVRPATETLGAIARVLGVPLPALLPTDTKEAWAYREGVAYGLTEVERFVAEVRRRLELRAGDGRRADDALRLLDDIEPPTGGSEEETG